MLAIATMLAGCATGRAPGTRREPPEIAFHNATDRALRMMSVSEIRVGGGAQVRLGRVAPVAAGGYQVFRRRDDPAPLAPEAMVRWEDAAGVLVERRVMLTEALDAATGQPGEVLVFEVRPGRKAVVYLADGRSGSS
jgi:hypothetical protein